MVGEIDVPRMAEAVGDYCVGLVASVVVDDAVPAAGGGASDDGVSMMTVRVDVAVRSDWSVAT